MVRINRSPIPANSSADVAAIGLRAHSGWAALVVVTGHPHFPEILGRKRIELVDSTIPGAAQPYHTAEEMALKDAKKFIDRCIARTSFLARNAFASLIEEFRSTGTKIVGCGYLLSSARPLPALEGILASHPLIHTAEGEFFRNAIADAAEHHNLPVTKIKERDVYNVASEKFDSGEEELQKRINALGKTLGPPWRQDEKLATVVGLLALTAP
jgi:hypothetical protein